MSVSDCVKRTGYVLTASVLMIVALPIYMAPARAASTERIVAMGDGNNIISLNPDGTDVKVLGSGRAPNLSPDGTKIVFSDRVCGSTAMDVFIMDVDGGNRRDLTPNTCNYYDYQARFSPDGTRIVFTTDREDHGAPSIYTMDLDGSNIFVVLHGITLRNGGDWPSWSTDGTKITFRGGTSGIATINADGTNLTAIGAGQTKNESPVDWSPDGSKLVFAADICGGVLNPGICLADSDGSNQRRLAAGGYPSWSPDGTKIVFVDSVHQPDGTIRLAVLNIADLSVGGLGVQATLPDWGIVQAGPNTQPTIYLPAMAAMQEGDTLATTSSFTDDSSGWTATVDYGDGTGVQPLSLAGTSFSLNHVYQDQGTYSIAVVITDNGGAVGTATAPVVVSNAAPVVGSVVPSTADPIAINTTVGVSSTFMDPGILDTHTALWSWGDGTTTAGTVTESNGSGTVTGSHTYAQAGVYEATLTVTDNDNGTGSSLLQYVVVYNPSTAAFFNGSGKYTSATGWYMPDPTVAGEAKFGINARYVGGILDANAKLSIKKEGLEFESTTCQWLAVNAAKAQLKCNATLNGSGSYSMLITAIEAGSGASADLLRIKITTLGGATVYDTQAGAADIADPTMPIDKGSVNIHE